MLITIHGHTGFQWIRSPDSPRCCVWVLGMAKDIQAQFNLIKTKKKILFKEILARVIEAYVLIWERHKRH